MATLRERLARLTPPQALRLLGPRGTELLRAGGKFPVDLDTQVRQTDEKLRVELPGAVATVAASPRGPLRMWCTACPGRWEHLGAALSLVLEEKVALGLASEPAAAREADDGAKPLTDEELVARALADREERARTEPMEVHPAEPGTPWTD